MSDLFDIRRDIARKCAFYRSERGKAQLQWNGMEYSDVHYPSIVHQMAYWGGAYNTAKSIWASIWDKMQ